MPAPALGSAVITASLQPRAGVPADQVDEVIFGNVISAGLGQNSRPPGGDRTPGLNVSIGATTISKVCGSGLKAVMLAAQAIQCGDAQGTVVAGGMEETCLSALPTCWKKPAPATAWGTANLSIP